MSYRFDEDEYPLKTFTERDWGDTSRLLLQDGYNTAPLPSQRGRVAPARRWVDSLPRDRGGSHEERCTTFLDHVVLDPGWEASHPPKDIICFTLNETIDHMRKNPPPDRYNGVFMIFLLHGIAISLPWNMISVSHEYFTQYKLNCTDMSGADYSQYYSRYSCLAFQAPQFLFTLLNLVSQRNRGPSPTGTVISLLSLVTLLIGSVVMAMLDSKTWSSVFFIVTISVLLLLGVFTGILLSNMFGLAAIFPKNYTNAIILGMHLGSIMSSLATLSSIALSPGVRICAVYIFLTTIIVILVTFDTFFIFPYMRFYRHYRAILAMKHSANAGAVIKERLKRPMLHTFKQIWRLVVSVYLTYFTTFTIYPAILEDTDKVDNSIPVPDLYWAPLICFLSFGVFALVGSLVCLCLKKPSGRYLWIPVLLRLVIVLPFFVLCNYHSASRTLAVLIQSDYAFIAGSILFGLTHGYLSALSMMHGPSEVETEYASAVGMMLAATMTLGILCGTNASTLVRFFVDNVGYG